MWSYLVETMPIYNAAFRNLLAAVEEDVQREVAEREWRKELAKWRRRARRRGNISSDPAPVCTYAAKAF